MHSVTPRHTVRLTSGFKNYTIEKMDVTFDYEPTGKFADFELETDGSVQTIFNQTYEKER